MRFNSDRRACVRITRSATMWHVSAVLTAVLALAVFGPVPRTRGARILALETWAAKSHWNFLSAVIGALTDGGHSVTVFTPFPEGDRENYTEVDMSGVFPITLAKDLVELRSIFSRRRTLIKAAVDAGRQRCDRLQEHGRLRDIVAGGLSVQFDAVLVEPALWDCVTWLAAESGLPLIYAVSLPTMNFPLSDRAVLGDFPNPAVVSPLLADHAVPRTFAQRLANVANTVYGSALREFRELWVTTTDPRPYDSRPTVLPSLVFVNGHYASEAARPIPSNAVYVGGVHLKPAKKIPQDILEFIENSPRGVILFTFGSTVAMNSIPESIQKTFIETIGELPQRVLLKYEIEMKNKPKNVMIKKWFPQRDILEHPNVKLFISHGGISGMYEAINGGVPVLGFPLFADQQRNIDNLVESGMAISMEIYTVTKDQFLANILRLTNDQKYKNNAKTVSNIFKDRPITPQNAVVYWTEYVIRHKGAPHLKSHGLNLMWYQYFLLDVLAVTSIAFFLILFVTKKIVKFIYKQILLTYLYIIKKEKFE